MKTEQINLAIAIAECGSITKAAKEMFISQPNASHMLHSLEQELGGALFSRSRNGSVLTKRGEEFMRYAGTLRRTLERIAAGFGEAEATQRLTVLSYQYVFAENAFLKLCKEYIATPKKMAFKLNFIDTLNDAVDRLERDEADVAIGICREDLFGIFYKAFRLRGMVTESLCSRPLHLTVSKNHPLAWAEQFRLEDYLPYPCLASIGHDQATDYVRHSVTDYVPFLRKTIYIDPGETRVRLAAETDGFIISTPYSKETLERYELIGKPIPDSNVRFFSLCCAERQQDPLLARFMALLKAEIALL